MTNKSEINKSKGFEKSMAELEELTRKISNPETDLETAIRCFEDGMKHYKKCLQILNSAEQKIETYDLYNKEISEE